MSSEPKKTEIDNGYILTDGDIEVDPNSMFDSIEDEYKKYIYNSSIKKEIKLYKDNVEYIGNLKKFILKETEDGKTILTVVFELKK